MRGSTFIRICRTFFHTFMVFFNPFRDLFAWMPGCKRKCGHRAADEQGVAVAYRRVSHILLEPVVPGPPVQLHSDCTPTCHAFCQESFQNISALASAATTAWNSKFELHACAHITQKEAMSQHGWDKHHIRRNWSPVIPWRIHMGWVDEWVERLWKDTDKAPNKSCLPKVRVLNAFNCVRAFVTRCNILWGISA